MDAHALLSAQGWRGSGHSLHKTDDSIGLAKPLLLNRKNNTKGLGQKQHFTSDQWWMNAFDEQLKGLDTSTQGRVVQTVKTGKLNALERGALAKYSVYATFVRGGFLQGTITPELTDGSSVSDKSDEQEAQPPAAEGASEEIKGKESKEERRARKEARQKKREEKALRKAARAVRRERKAARREERAKKKKMESLAKQSAKEEKRRRRAAKEERRRLKESAKQ